MQYIVTVKLEGVVLSSADFGSNLEAAKKFISNNAEVAKTTGMDLTTEMLSLPDPVESLERVLNKYM